MKSPLGHDRKRLRQLNDVVPFRALGINAIPIEHCFLISQPSIIFAVSQNPAWLGSGQRLGPSNQICLPSMPRESAERVDLSADGNPLTHDSYLFGAINQTPAQ